MADFSIPITVPDAKVAELVDALNWAWADDTPMTGPELRAELKRRVEDQLREIYKNYKRRQVQLDDLQLE